MKSRITPVCLLLLSVIAVFAQSTPEAWTGNARWDVRINDLLGKMTLEEKVGQLVQLSSQDFVTGPATSSDVMAEIRASHAGSMLNVTGAAYSRKLQTVAVKETRLGVPMIFGYDVIHGFRTVFPIPLGQAASFDMQAIEASERISANEATSAGIHWTFSPMVDIARDPRWGRMAEGSGEDTYLGIQIAKARIHGFQGDDLSKNDTMLACAKHFAAYGAAQAGRDYFTTEVSERTMREDYLPPFRACVDAGVGSFMAAFNDLNGLPASANPWLLKTILRQEWGFRGFVVSDWGSVNELKYHGVAATGKDAARVAFNAGVEMDMESKLYYPNLVTLVKEGLVSEESIRVAVGRVLAAKAKLGLLDDPFRYTDEAREKATILSPDNLEAARDLARRTFVLLQNLNGTLPVKKDAKIALVGPLADAAKDQIGCWHGRGDPKDSVTLRAAFAATFGDRLVYARGCDVRSDDTSGFADAVAAAKKADVVVAVVGESEDMSGEGHSRAELGLPGRQAQLLAELRKTGKPIAALVMCGRALTLESVLPLADSWLVLWHPGTMAGPAVVDVVTGAYSPSGKLPVTFPRSVGQIPIFYNHKNTGRPQPAGERVQYRSNYIDSPNSPLFPFGFGLSYSKFTYDNLRLSSKKLREGDAEIKVTVTLKNAGNVDADEVAQFYVRDLVGSVTRPVRELKGFQKLHLKKGEKRDVTFTLTPADLAFWRADMTYGTEPGRFEVFVGGDSDATLSGSFELLK
ncbi:glycosyl hydrolase [Opitutaceae bacterium EW11]|nr:glycosyl hydrolase [Opitutaceae bacterium EW11]